MWWLLACWCAEPGPRVAGCRTAWWRVRVCPGLTSRLGLVPAHWWVGPGPYEVGCLQAGKPLTLIDEWEDTKMVLASIGLFMA